MMPISRIEVLDYKAFGEKVAEWSLNPTMRPKTLDEMKQQTRDILEIPDRIRHLRFIDVDLSEMVIRLPNAQMVEESKERFANDQSEYPIAPYYRNILEDPDSVSNTDMLYARIADYTIAQCT